MVGLGWLHLEADQWAETGKSGLDVLGIRSEWNEFWDRSEPGALARSMAAHARLVGAKGAVLSLSSRVLPTSSQILNARGVLSLAVLFGPAERCKTSFLARDAVALRLGPSHWEANNAHFFSESAASEAWSHLRLDAFHKDGSRRPTAEIAQEVCRRC
jgi:hypothetical protein